MKARSGWWGNDGVGSANINKIGKANGFLVFRIVIPLERVVSPSARFAFDSVRREFPDHSYSSPKSALLLSERGRLSAPQAWVTPITRIRDQAYCGLLACRPRLPLQQKGLVKAQRR